MEAALDVGDVSDADYIWPTMEAASDVGDVSDADYIWPIMEAASDVGDVSDADNIWPTMEAASDVGDVSDADNIWPTMEAASDVGDVSDADYIWPIMEAASDVGDVSDADNIWPTMEAASDVGDVSDADYIWPTMEAASDVGDVSDADNIWPTMEAASDVGDVSDADNIWPTMEAASDVAVPVQMGAAPHGNGTDTPSGGEHINHIEADQSEKNDEEGDLRTGAEDLASQNGTNEPTTEELGMGDGFRLDNVMRNKLFEQGLLYEQRGQQDSALKCFLGCLCGLTEGTSFSLLPQCLRNVADIYYQKEEYEKAVGFVQAEKLYYENALIDTSDLQWRIAESISENNEKTENDIPANTDQMRAEEYEHLAKLCLDRKQCQLALEYAGKATKIRQELYGDHHPTTLQSLDFFATMYADVGKQQYTVSMEQLSTEEDQDLNQTSSSQHNGSRVDNPEQRKTTPSSILRKRTTPHSTEKRRSGQHVHFQEEDLSTDREQSQTHQEQDEWVSNKLLATLLLMCLLFMLVLSVFLYCRVLMEGSASCLSVKSYVHYCYMRLKFYYYYFSSTKRLKYA